MDRDFSFDPGSDVMRSRAKEIGNKMKICFWIEIIEIIAPILLIIVSTGRIFSAVMGGNFTQAENEVLSLNMIVGIAVVVLSIIYAIILISLEKYDNNFKYAGLLYIAVQVTSLVKTFTSGSILAFAMGLVNIAVTLGFVKLFIDALATSTRLVNRVIATSLEAYVNWYMFFALASIICTFAAFIPIINLFAALASIVIFIGSIVIAIWRLVLLWQAASAMQRHGKY